MRTLKTIVKKITQKQDSPTNTLKIHEDISLPYSLSYQTYKYLSHELEEAVNYLKNGEVVAFPTETVYGLGGNVFDEVSVKKIFEAKRRPADNPLIVHISCFEMLKRLTNDIPPSGSLLDQLLKRFWPGPLTVLFPAKKEVSVFVRGSEKIKTVAVRMPNHPISLALIHSLDSPIAAPSANLSGRPSPTTAEHVYFDLKGIIPYIVDGGSTHFGLESTVLDVSSTPPMILRPGGVTFEDLQKFLPDLEIYKIPTQNKSTSTPKTSSQNSLLEIDSELQDIVPATPGLKYRHYSPNARVILVSPNSTSNMDCSSFFENIISQHQKSSPDIPSRIGILCLSSSKSKFENILTEPESKYDQLNGENLQENRICKIYDLGQDSTQMAQNLFATLRKVDEDEIQVAYVEGIGDTGLGLAVMNRLKKAASETVFL